MLRELVAVAKLGVAPIVDGELRPPAAPILKLRLLRQQSIELWW